MRKLRTMHLFAGAGGGILADLLLGHQPVCAVEINEYCQQVLSARQADGTFPWFPVFADVQKFDGKRWRGLVDCVSGGFPCQDISAAGPGTGIAGGVEVASGVKWPESSVRFDPDSSSWKTAHCLWEEVLPSSSVTLPRWGMTRNGHVSAHPTAERPINVTASGLWPTPNVPNGGRSCAHVTEWSESGKTAYHNGKKVQVGLEHAAKYWPTPTVCGNYQAPKDGTKRGTGLATAAKTWPTPTVNDSKNSTLPPSQINHDNIPGALLRDGETAGGQLNPTWVEWLMGWPLGWTDLKPLAMDKFREWQQQHSPFFRKEADAA